MKKNLRTIKTLMLIGILFAGVFIIIVPSSNASIVNMGIINLSSNVDVNWSATVAKQIKPRGGILDLGLDIKYSVASGGGLFSWGIDEIAERLYYGQPINVHLEILAEPDWAQVSLSEYDVTFIISADLPETKSVHLYITAREDAPAFLAGEIRIKAQVPTKTRLLFPNLEGFEKTFSLAFEPEYNALIDVQAVPNTKKVGPMDTAVFPIGVENRGNERTEVEFVVKSKTDGWKALITNVVALDVGQKTTVYLSIQPPRGLGYHYDIGDIIVEATPTRALDTSVRGAPKLVSVQVESNGFSLLGAELVFAPLIVIIILLFLLYRFILKPRIIKRE
jgi:hypothetical protein